MEFTGLNIDTQLGLKLGLYDLRTSTLSHYLITGGTKVECSQEIKGSRITLRVHHNSY